MSSSILRGFAIREALSLYDDQPQAPIIRQPPDGRANPQPGLILMIIEPKPVRRGNGQNHGRGGLSGGAGVSQPCSEVAQR
jgi:hypothetical protein